MSGGSYEYFYLRAESAASTLRERHHDEPHVLALADLLLHLAEVMQDIEWADSCDRLWTPELDERIRALLTPGAEVAQATTRAELAAAALEEAIRRSRTP